MSRANLLLGFAVFVLTVTVLYLVFGRVDPCVRRDELRARYFRPLSESDRQRIEARPDESPNPFYDSSEGEIAEEESRRMYAAMPARAERQYSTASYRCARSFR